MKNRSIVHLLLAAVTLATGIVSLTGTAASARTLDTMPHKIYGVIRSIAPNGNSLQFEKRNKVVITVDISEAQANHTTGAMPLNQGVSIYGVPNRDGTFHALFFGHVSDNPSRWGPDN